MVHIEIPDGVLPLWLVALGFAILIPLLSLSTRKLEKGSDKARTLPIMAALSAIMLVVMSLELGFTHVNLSVLSGIILGPYPAIIAVFVTNVMLSLVGHGGITVIGLNTLLVSTEAVLGFFIYKRMLGTARPSVNAGVATVIAMMTSALLLVGIGALSNVELGEFLGEHDENGRTRIPLKEFAVTVLTIAILGTAIESVIVGSTVGYLAAVRPDVLAGGAERW
ncbi:MAG: energy-coupling factor ABC transporter permease [Candidatus Hydrothermarchaeaceae archaeon]